MIQDEASLNCGTAARYLKNEALKLPVNFTYACLRAINDQRFQLWPASINKHQPYVGGLCLHTAEVLEIALATAKASSVQVNTDVLTVAAIFHDYGKIWDYAVKDNDRYNKIVTAFESNRGLMGEYAAMIWEKVPHRYLVRHPARSYAEWMDMSGYYAVDDELRLQISHAILAHHGRVEWNSPVEPQTIEAQILHHSDILSGRYDKKRGPFGS